MQIDQLVAELLARGDMNDDTTVELNRILAAWRAGSLDPDDESYVQALHSRLTSAPVIIDEEPDVPAEPSMLDGLTIADWRERALRAEAELAQLQDVTSTT